MVLTEDGTIASTGTFEALKDSDKYIRSLAPSYNNKNQGAQDSNEKAGTEVAEYASGIHYGDVPQKYPLEKSVSAAAPNDDRSEGRGKMTSSLPYYVKSLMSISFLFYCLLILFQTACRVIQPLWLRFWTDANARNPNENPGKWVGVYVMFSVLNLGGLITQFWCVVHCISAWVIQLRATTDCLCATVSSCSALYQGRQSHFTGKS